MEKNISEIDKQSLCQFMQDLCNDLKMSISLPLQGGGMLFFCVKMSHDTEKLRHSFRI